MIGTGRIHVYYGDGKGKTTAAMGLVLRAAGSGLDVLMFQFLKDNSSSERIILEQIPNVTCLPGKDRVKFVSKMNADEKARLKHYNNKALDEIIKCAVQLGVLSEEKLVEFLEHKPRGLEIVLTGHVVSDKVLELADYVTEIRKVKHPYDQGITAREGIEY